jgi:hypothetical protein
MVNEARSTDPALHTALVLCYVDMLRALWPAYVLCARVRVYVCRTNARLQQHADVEKRGGGWQRARSGG